MVPADPACGCWVAQLGRGVLGPFLSQHWRKPDRSVPAQPEGREHHTHVLQLWGGKRSKRGGKRRREGGGGKWGGVGQGLESRPSSV